MDRISRQGIDEGYDLCKAILKAGVHIITLSPERDFGPEAVKSLSKGALELQLILERAAEESETKSDRVGAAWAQKKLVAKDGVVMTDRLPGWVQRKGDKLQPIPAAAAVVRRIFRLAADGYGAPSIIKKLTAEGVKSIGRTSRWTRAYIGTILNGRRVLGEYQPRDRDGKPVGDPIKGYYPAIVSDDEWKRAHAAVQQRRRFRGSVSKAQVNVFAGLLTHARDDDDTYILSTRRSRVTGKKFSIIVNTEGDQGKTKQYSLPYEVFETAVLSCLREIDPHEILNGDHPPDESATLAGEMVGIEAELGDAATFMEANGFSPTIGKRITDLETRKRELAERLADARTEASHPLSESWGECQSLADTLAAAADPYDARMRLRSALRRIVVGIRLLIVPRKQDRIAVIQVDFGGKQSKRRNYVLLYRPNGRVRPGEWRVLSYKLTKTVAGPAPQNTWVKVVDGVPESDADYWTGTESYLTEMSPADLEIMFTGCERRPIK